MTFLVEGISDFDTMVWEDTKVWEGMEVEGNI